MTTKRILSVALLVLVAASLAMAASFPAGTKFTVRVSNELSSGRNMLATYGKVYCRTTLSRTAEYWRKPAIRSGARSRWPTRVDA